ncbi:uncharacterized protein LOC114335775 isoform X1 [Diabrotica virgifera virgifera]|uniref:Uncharacterized protein LOC114335775 isoform X1 n=1 Tax=Diabrotica virgifera virgifera TaxID=50390 RepID=A0A6P7GAL1_DIAVI|nr:uncharacterized protein LOC114335775 isoform X1 [Diabrotica virgifera virgifera]
MTFKMIPQTDEAVKAINDRVRFLEKKLKNHYLPKVKQKELKRELMEARKLLESYQVQLVQLKAQTDGSYLIGGALIMLVLALIIYMIYSLYNAFLLMIQSWNEESSKHNNFYAKTGEALATIFI